jgi:MoxR-like ATPase
MPAGSLPTERSSFVGRRTEIRRVRQLLSGARLVTLVGPGGVGKTRLAIRVARQMKHITPDGAPPQGARSAVSKVFMSCATRLLPVGARG